MTQVAGAAAAAHLLTNAGVDGRVEAAEAHGVCANCEARLSGPYCHACGQHAHLHSRFRDLLAEMFEGVAHLDGRLWRTLPLLVFRPGRLSRAWIAGKRVRYVSPLHAFLFTVFLLFVIPSFTGRHLVKLPSVKDVDQSQALERERVRLESKRSPAARTGKSTAENLGVQIGRKLRKVAEENEYYAYKVESLAYKLSFIMAPISVAILWLLLLFKRGYSLYDHGVVALYGLSVLAGLAAIAAALPPAWSRPFQQWMLVPAGVHAVVHLHGAYRLSWLGAVLRGIGLGLFTGVGFLLFLLGVLALGVLS